MPTKDESIADIIAKSGEARTALADTFSKLDGRMQELIQQAGGNPPGGQQKREMDALDAAMAALTAAMKQLALASQETLNQSPAAKRLADRLDGINKVLATEEAELADVAATVGAIGDAIAKVDKVLKGVSALLPLLAAL